MLYEYQCPTCKKTYEVWQGINDNHAYICKDCWVDCKRVFSVPQPKYNRGFYSVTLGREVKSHTDFEEGLRECRFTNWREKYVGDNSNPKDEWVEKREKAAEAERKEAQRMIENG